MQVDWHVAVEGGRITRWGSRSWPGDPTPERVAALLTLIPEAPGETAFEGAVDGSLFWRSPEGVAERPDLPDLPATIEVDAELVVGGFPPGAPVVVTLGDLIAVETAINAAGELRITFADAAEWRIFVGEVFPSRRRAYSIESVPG